MSKKRPSNLSIGSERMRVDENTCPRKDHPRTRVHNSSNYQNCSKSPKGEHKWLSSQILLRQVKLPFPAICCDELLQRRMPQHFLVGAKVPRVKVCGAVGQPKEEKNGAWAVIGFDERYPSAFQLKRVVDWCRDNRG